MSARRPSGPRPERAGGSAKNDLWVRVHLGQADTARLRELQTEEETPVDTIRRLIRTAAMVQPILLALERRPADPTQVSLAPTAPDDAVQRQADAMLRWVDDED